MLSSSVLPETKLCSRELILVSQYFTILTMSLARGYYQDI